MKIYSIIWMSRYSYPKVLVIVSKAIIWSNPAADRIRIPADMHAQKLTTELIKKVAGRF